MEIIEILKEIIPLLTGLAGLISTGIAAYFAVVNFIKHFKDKKATEIWNLVMTIADAAMKEAEASQLDGEGKKQLVIDTVKAGLEAAGLDLTAIETPSAAPVAPFAYPAIVRNMAIPVFSPNV